ncbi:hypothetical protein TSUD_261560 [Trifolium subterraneum]|nr:hypothetical protein TSUD_261560 [Trifolium subterraneum]
MHIFQKLFDGFTRRVRVYRCYGSSPGLALADSFYPNENTPLCSRNPDSPLNYVYPGTATERRDMIWQGKPEQRAPTAFYVPNMPELNYQLKQLMKLGRICEARDMFNKMAHRDKVSWTNLIAGYVNAADSNEALILFSNMWVDSGLQKDQFVVSVALKACALGMNIYFGELLHGFSVKSGLINSVFVSSALVDMYMKVGKTEQGCSVFEKMTTRNVVSWTAVIVGLVHAVGYDSHTFAIALKASADSGLLHYGKAIHAQTIKQGFNETAFVVNTLGTMYNKCGKPDYVMQLFGKTRMPDVVSWTNLIATYVQMGEEEHALDAFKRMRKSYVSPNEYTFASVISACANLAVTEWGEQIHGHKFLLQWRMLRTPFCHQRKGLLNRSSAKTLLSPHHNEKDSRYLATGTYRETVMRFC